MAQDKQKKKRGPGESGSGSGFNVSFDTSSADDFLQEIKKPAATSPDPNMPELKAMMKRALERMLVEDFARPTDTDRARSICECGDPTCRIGPFKTEKY